MNRLRVFVCLATFALSAATAQAALVSFSGSFLGSGMNPDIVPGGTLSGTFSFLVDVTGPDGLFNHIPGSLELTLNQDTIGGVTFSVAAGNVGGVVTYGSGVPRFIFIGGTPSTPAVILTGDGQSDFWVRFQSPPPSNPGPPVLTGLTADNAAGVFANPTARSGSLTIAVVPEPSTLLMLSIGAAGLVCRRLRRRA